jgi:hypothetical protein
MNTQPEPVPPLILRLTSQQRDRLLEFLKRATLSGKEVPAWAELSNLITTAKPEPPPPANQSPPLHPS